jgi:dUTP diphosphatase
VASEGLKLRVFLVRPSLARLPAYASATAAGLDLCAALETPLTLGPGERAAIPTGLSIALPPGHEGQVRPRSGLASKHGVTVLNAPGTIDEDYRGEVAVLLVNLGREPYAIAPGDRIAQLVVAPVARVALETVVQLSALGVTERGSGGFGSSGR